MSGFLNFSCVNGLMIDCKSLCISCSQEVGWASLYMYMGFKWSSDIYSLIHPPLINMFIIQEMLSIWTYKIHACIILNQSLGPIMMLHSKYY